VEWLAFDEARSSVSVELKLRRQPRREQVGGTEFPAHKIGEQFDGLVVRKVLCHVAGRVAPDEGKPRSLAKQGSPYEDLLERPITSAMRAQGQLDKAAVAQRLASKCSSLSLAVAIVVD